jgi:hypothetical protein
MHHTTRLIVALVILCGPPAISGAQVAKAPAAPKLPAVNRLTTLSGFTVEYPKKDWQVLVGTGSSLVVFAHKTREATVAIERTRVEHPLAPSELTPQTAKLESEDWLTRRPEATGFTSRILDWAATKIIVIDFTQPGPQGPEHVRMYTMPRGSDWYRVVCTTTQVSFEKHIDTCHRIALSLTPSQ